MTDIEHKALELVNAVLAVRGSTMPLKSIDRDEFRYEALCRAIEQHEAFRQEVSDAVVAFMVDKPGLSGLGITRFIIAKPDPLDRVLSIASSQVDKAVFRERLDAEGLEIREKKK